MMAAGNGAGTLAAKRVLHKADQTMGALADRIRAHRWIARRPPSVPGRHPPPLASAFFGSGLTSSRKPEAAAVRGEQTPI